jgi:hypothetical protein
VFLVGELTALRLSVICVEVVITMGTLHVASPGQLDRTAERGSLGQDLLVEF